MSSYLRLKEHISTDFKNNRFVLDVQTLLEDVEKYKKAYATLKSFQNIVGVEQDDLLASKVYELKKESDVLQQLLKLEDKAEVFDFIKELKKKNIIEE
jgi:hypothetical protein